MYRKKTQQNDINPTEEKLVKALTPIANPVLFNHEIIILNTSIEYGRMEAKIINNSGQVMLIQNIKENFTQARISTKELPEGAYSLILSDKQNQVLMSRSLFKVKRDTTVTMALNEWII